jgi:ATP-dependent DNA helicase PIF1
MSSFSSSIEKNNTKNIVLNKVLENTNVDLSMNELSREQKYAYQKFIKGENLFITGPGGTGKTRLIKHLLQYSKKIGKQIDVCAMTGCAAILLNCNASTLHSWSGIKIANGKKEAIISKVLRNKSAMNMWKKSKILVIDEVSMLSEKIFEIIEEIARIVNHSSSPFGGIQVVFTGDFFQLPPIGTEEEPSTMRFCFESSVWNKVFKRENIIELKTMFRQKDPLYVEILNQIRKGELDEKNREILKTYVKREYNPEENNHCVPTKLFAIRSKTDYINQLMFSKLEEKEYECGFVSKTNCKTYLNTTTPIETEILKQCSQLSKKEIDYEVEHLSNNTPMVKNLRLKKNAAVMCTVNLDMEQSICNGSQGIIIDIIETEKHIIPVVQFSNGVIKSLMPYFWQSENYPNVAVGQFPLCLAWALTIHKIQGTTLKMAEIDVGQSIFEYGQSYVALSRVESLNGLYLTAFHPQKIKANPKVIAFYKSIPEIEYPDETVGIDFSSFEYKELEPELEPKPQVLSEPKMNKNIKIIKL